MKGMGVEFLEFSFQKISIQTFKDFEIVVSDHSQNDLIKSLCDKYSNTITIRYFKNTIDVGSSSSNINNAISKCSGEYIKVLFQDDFLFDENSLEITEDYIEKNIESKWFVSSSEHSMDGLNFYRKFVPRWNNQMILGNNTISSPSVLTIKNDTDKISFDKNYIWLMDCDYYQRCYSKFGNPVIIEPVTVVNRTWESQLTNTIPEEIKRREHLEILKKYKII